MAISDILRPSDPSAALAATVLGLVRTKGGAAPELRKCEKFGPDLLAPLEVKKLA